MVAFPEYTYIAVLGVICGFIFAFGIGANDVANAFGSSVSARSLKLWQAIVLGSIMEFAGAILLGANVTGTIRGKIVRPEFYEDEPELFMFGSLCALIVGMTWLLIATAKEFPVSTTHDIVAAYLGFSIAAHGFESIDWKTCGKLFASWFAAPIFAGVISSLFFKLLMEFVLKNENNTFERALTVYPIVVFVAFTANLFFILFKSSNNIEMDEWEYGHYVVLPSSLGGGLVMAIITWCCICPWLRKRVQVQHGENLNATEKMGSRALEQVKDVAVVDGFDDSDSVGESDYDVDECELPSRKPVQRSSRVVVVKEIEPVKEEYLQQPETVAKVPSSNWFVRGWDYFADNTFRQDLHEISMGESKRAAAIWENSTEYDLQVEHLFQYLQVFTACLASFAHGANDVANAIAPVSGILQIYQDGEFVSKAEVNKGILAMGGAAIGLGFTLFGYRIVKAVGFKLTAMSPSRGFCVELAASLAVSLASFMQIPVSTTQCLVGATCGVGLAAGGVGNVEWMFLARTMSGWIGIFFVVAIITAGFFSFCAYSPSL